MRMGRISGACIMLAAVFGCPLSLRADAIIEVQQRIIETEDNDDTTTIAVRILNRTSQPADEVQVFAPTPRGYRLKAASILPARDAERYVWTVGALKAGEAREFRLQWEPLPDLADVPLKVSLRAVSRINTDSVIEAPARQHAARITIVAPENATVGVPATLRIGIANVNNRPARDVVLQASFATGLTHALGKELENPLGTIEPGQTRTIPLEVIPTQYGELRGKVRVQIGQGAVTEREFLIQARPTRLTLQVSAQAQVPLRSPTLVTFHVQNNASELNKRVRLVAQLPAGLGFASASDGGQHVADGNCIIWDVGDLKPNDQRSFKLVVMAQTAGEQKLTAIMSADARDAQSHSVSVQVQPSSTESLIPKGRP